MVSLGQRFCEFPALRGNEECLSFISKFDEGFPRPNPGGLPEKCVIGRRPAGNLHYVSYGPDYTDPESFDLLTPNRRYSYIDICDYASGSLVGLVPDEVVYDLYPFIFDDGVAEHFRNMIAEEDRELIDDGVLQGELHMIMSASFARVNNYFFDMLKGVYLSGYLPVGWHGEYPDNYGLLVALPSTRKTAWG